MLWKRIRNIRYTYSVTDVTTMGSIAMLNWNTSKKADLVYNSKIPALITCLGTNYHSEERLKLFQQGIGTPHIPLFKLLVDCHQLGVLIWLYSIPRGRVTLCPDNYKGPKGTGDVNSAAGFSPRNTYHPNPLQDGMCTRLLQYRRRQQ